MIINCPNCGAPLTHLTSGDICEYCGTSFGISLQLNVYADLELKGILYEQGMEALASYGEWRRKHE